MNPSEIKSVLSRIGARANKKLGQHFLIDRATLETIVTTADIHAGDRVLEIGPGLGVLTRALIEKGAEVMAIEQDRRFVEYLHAEIPTANVTPGDAAVIHWHELVEDRPWKFVSNLPYGITSLALRKALWAPRPPEKIVVLIQREVAERAVAKDGKTSLLSLMIALASREARIVKRVPAGAFFPPPNVEAAVLEIAPLSWKEREEKWGIDPDKVMEAAKRGFAHPRKFAASNLQVDPSVLESVGLPAKVRAEAIKPEVWVALTKRLA